MLATPPTFAFLHMLHGMELLTLVSFLIGQAKFGIHFDLVNTSLITPQCKVWPKGFLEPSHTELLISCGQGHMCACLITALSFYRTSRNLFPSCFTFFTNLHTNSNWISISISRHAHSIRLKDHSVCICLQHCYPVRRSPASNIFKFSCSLILSIRHRTLS